MKDVLTKFAYTAQGQVEGFENGGDLPETIINIISVIIGVLGIVAVIVVIIGGILYMTSTGESGKVKKAKDTILYGVIGLIVCILAFAIVNFIIRSIVVQQA